MPPSPAELHDFAKGYTAAWCSQNPASVAAFFSENGWLAVNDEAPAVGRDAITKVALSFMSAFPDLQVEMEDLEVRREDVVYRWLLTGTNAGPQGNGQKVRLRGSETWRFGVNGLISSSQGSFDAVNYRRQLDGHRA